MLLLVADLVVCDPKLQAKDMLQEHLESDIKVVCYKIQVVLDVCLHDLLAGLVVACKVVVKLEEVLLEVVLLHICAAKGYKHRHCRLG